MAVVHHGYAAKVGAGGEWLHVLQFISARRGVPHMTDAAVTLQFLQRFVTEHLGQQAAALAAGNVPPVGAGDSRALLAAVLKGVEPKIS